MKLNAILLLALLIPSSLLLAADTPNVTVGQFVGDVVTPVFAPKPDYAWSAQTNHVQGTGIFQLRIRPDGTVSSVELIRSTGWRDLDKSSTAAFSKWRFRPVARSTTIKVPITFSLGIPVGPSHSRGIQGPPVTIPH
jgi:TonB family protein